MMTIAPTNGFSPHRMRSACGFTLLELLVTLVVGAILYGLAVPSMRAFIQNARITTQTNELVADLNFARSEAVKRAGHVVVCQSNNPQAATPVCNNSGNWQSGRLIFLDAGVGTPPVYNNTYSTVDGDILLRIRAALDGNNTLTTVLVSSGAADGSITFDRMGMAMIGTTDTTNFRLCDDRLAPKGRSVQVSATGRPSTGSTGQC